MINHAIEESQLKKEETSTGKSQLPIKLVVKGKGFEISAEGTISSLGRELDALAEFRDKVAEKLEIVEEGPEVIPEAMPSAEEVAITPTADIPVIKPSKSTMGSLESLFNTPWGRTPRFVSEVMKALEVNAVYDSRSSVTVYLTRLVRRGKLRRIEKQGKWAYFKPPGE